jgi:cbb3-type cytochrome oxidase subunit 3
MTTIKATVAAIFGMIAFLVAVFLWLYRKALRSMK